MYELEHEPPRGMLELLVGVSVSSIPSWMENFDSGDGLKSCGKLCDKKKKE